MLTACFQSAGPRRYESKETNEQTKGRRKEERNEQTKEQKNDCTYG